MAYIGNIGDKIQIEVSVDKVITYEARNPFSYYDSVQEKYIYILSDEDGNVLVAKPSNGMLGVSVLLGDNLHGFNAMGKGDKFIIKATIKAHSLYNETEQTVLTRVKCIERTLHVPTYEERQAEKEEQDRIAREKQIAGLSDGDIIKTMPYKQYKSHYSDFETLAGSYFQPLVYDWQTGEMEKDPRRPSLIDVIIRKGELANSGVRGKHFKKFLVSNSDGSDKYVVKAVSPENAIAQIAKKHPENEWHVTYDWNCLATDSTWNTYKTIVIGQEA